MKYRLLQTLSACSGVIFFIFTLLITHATLAETNQSKQNELKKEISSVSKSLNSSRQLSKKLERNIRNYEEKLNKLSQELHQTERKINKLTTRLVILNKKRHKLRKQTNQQKEALAQQMQALYTSGKQSHLRLLLKQDDPSDISRTIKYFEYLNKHRLKRIKAIKTQLKKIETLQAEINADSEKLKKLQQSQSTKKLALKATVKEKDQVLKKQKKVVYSKEKTLAKLIKQEQHLKNVIQQLALKEQREAQRAKKEKEKQKRQQELATNTQKSITKAKSKGSKAAKVISRRYVPDRPFSSLRGKLSWPVRGAITRRFGSTRNSKQSWKGVIISAPGGTNVHAVARGKVEFSGRFRGYGYLIIIRHDKNYRSLYAYNRSVYKREGQIVKAGEVIAAVGSSGGQSKTGLYFEIRKGTSYQNPAKWCR